MKKKLEQMPQVQSTFNVKSKATGSLLWLEIEVAG